MNILNFILALIFICLTNADNCSQNCEICYNEAICINCKVGYLLNSQKNCKKCPQNCQKCILKTDEQVICLLNLNQQKQIPLKLGISTNSSPQQQTKQTINSQMIFIKTQNPTTTTTTTSTTNNYALDIMKAMLIAAGIVAGIWILLCYCCNWLCFQKGCPNCCKACHCCNDNRFCKLCKCCCCCNKQQIYEDK